mmetsp:Transcript_39/g.127  ORF Transcript_39/g.127 Transcript_39/m.127 type:complete len:265 (-) Transcript_39:901-1695(-)
MPVSRRNSLSTAHLLVLTRSRRKCHTPTARSDTDASAMLWKSRGRVTCGSWCVSLTKTPNRPLTFSCRRPTRRGKRTTALEVRACTGAWVLATVPRLTAAADWIQRHLVGGRSRYRTTDRSSRETTVRSTCRWAPSYQASCGWSAMGTESATSLRRTWMPVARNCCVVTRCLFRSGTMSTPPPISSPHWRRRGARARRFSFGVRMSTFGAFAGSVTRRTHRIVLWSATRKRRRMPSSTRSKMSGLERSGTRAHKIRWDRDLRTH